MKNLKCISWVINIIGYVFILSGVLQLFTNLIGSLILVSLGFIMTNKFVKVLDYLNINFSNKKRVILGIVLFCLFGFTVPKSAKSVDLNKLDNVAAVDTKKDEEEKQQQQIEKQAQIEAEQLAKEQAEIEAQKQAQLEAERLAKEQAEIEAQKQAQEAEALAQQQRQAQAAKEARIQAEAQVRNNAPIAQSYIANVNTKKFHQSGCSYLPDQNNQKTYGSRDEAVNAGYAPCKKCNP